MSVIPEKIEIQWHRGEQSVARSDHFEGAIIDKFKSATVSRFPSCSYHWRLERVLGQSCDDEQDDQQKGGHKNVATNMMFPKAQDTINAH